MAQSDVMCSFTRPKGTSQGEAVITHEVRITFRASGTHRSKNKSTSYEVLFVLEAPPGIGPGMKVLQTSALPLGYGAILFTWWVFFTRMIL